MELLDLLLQLLFLLQNLLDSLLQLLLLVLRGCLLFEDVLLKNLQLGHIILEGGQLLLISDGVLLQHGQSRLILLLHLALLRHLMLQLLVQLLELLKLGQLLAVLMECSLENDPF